MIPITAPNTRKASIHKKSTAMSPVSSRSLHAEGSNDRVIFPSSRVAAKSRFLEVGANISSSSGAVNHWVTLSRLRKDGNEVAPRK